MDVHLTNGPRVQIHLLPVERDIVSVATFILDVLRGVDEHPTGPTGRVVHAVTGFGVNALDEKLDDFAWRIELSTLLPGVVGELPNEVLVRPPENVGVFEVRVPVAMLREVRDELFQRRVREPVLVVEVDGGEDAVGDGVVLVLDRFEGFVQRRSDVTTLRGDVVLPCALRNPELLVKVSVASNLFTKLPIRLLVVLSEFLGDFARLFLEPVVDSLQEE
jgi:hypothetical protein